MNVDQFIRLIEQLKMDASIDAYNDVYLEGYLDACNEILMHLWRDTDD